MTHTTGKLVFKDGISNKVYLLDSKIDGAVGEILHIDMRRAGDARRLVACWNACQGISTQSLEENGVASMEKIVEMLNPGLTSLAGSRRPL